MRPMRSMRLSGTFVAVTITMSSYASGGPVAGRSRHELPAPAQPVTFAHAPAALQAVVRRSLAPQGDAAFQQAELVAKDATTDDRFGWSVALSGTTALIGAPYRHSSRGAAYVFVRSGTGWSQQAELTAKDAASGDGFGFSVALSGATALIGAPYKSSSMGMAYVFVRSGTSWSQQAELAASGAAAGDNFGRAVALSSGTALIGAPGRNSSRGAASVFVQSAASWKQQAELTAKDAATGARFGRSVALSGPTALIGTPGNNPPGSPTRLTGSPSKSLSMGAAYVFVLAGASWSQQAELTAKDAAAGDEFGSSVSLSGSTALIGALYKNLSRGAAYVFVRSGTTWNQKVELTAKNAAINGYFGSAVSLSGATALISAVGQGKFTGAAYVFVLTGAGWSQHAELVGSDAVSNDFFGWSVAVSATAALIGAPDKDTSKGSVYVFAP